MNDRAEHKEVKCRLRFSSARPSQARGCSRTERPPGSGADVALAGLERSLRLPPRVRIFTTICARRCVGELAG